MSNKTRSQNRKKYDTNCKDMYNRANDDISEHHLYSGRFVNENESHGEKCTQDYKNENEQRMYEQRARLVDFENQMTCRDNIRNENEFVDGQKTNYCDLPKDFKRLSDDDVDLEQLKASKYSFK